MHESIKRWLDRYRKTQQWMERVEGFAWKPYQNIQKKQREVIFCRVADTLLQCKIQKGDIMDYIEAHRYSFANKSMLEKEKLCGCFYCLEIFSPKEIEEWWEDEPELTAVCPYCGIDSIIGESIAYPLTKEFLEKMHQAWF